MQELSIVITNEKLIQAGDILTCVANEINQHIPFVVTRDEDEGRCFIYGGKQRIEIPLNDKNDSCNYEDISDFLKYIKKEINSRTFITNLRIRDLTYADSVSPNTIDFQDVLHPTPSLKMLNNRKLLNDGCGELYRCLPKTKTFWITKDMESILRRHFNVIENIYAFKLSFDDMSCDGLREQCRDIDSDSMWKQMYYTRNGSLRFTSAFDIDGDIGDNKFMFYMDETQSKRFFILFDFHKRQAYLLHQRTQKVQTFESLDKNSQVVELMFVHDNNDCVRLFKRRDSAIIHEDDAICEEMENMKVYKLEFNTFNDNDVARFYVEAKQENEQIKNQLMQANRRIADLEKILQTLREAIAAVMG